jgi:hypothetical protein
MVLTADCGRMTGKPSVTCLGEELPTTLKLPLISQ